MASKVTVLPIELDADSEAFGIVQVLAASIVALTAVELVVFVTQHIPWSVPTRLFFVRNAGWLLIPAALWVGWVSRCLYGRRILALVGSFASAYFALTQFRGMSTWGGTFDQFMSPATVWQVPGAIGIVLAIAISFFPGARPAGDHSTLRMLGLLGAATALTAILPKFWRDDSDYASLRWIYVAVALVCVAAVQIYVRYQNRL